MDDSGVQGAMRSDLLRDPPRATSDIRMAAMAIRHGWIKPERKAEVGDLMTDMATMTVKVTDVDGVERLAMSRADYKDRDQAIAAARVLVSMDPPTAKHEHDIKGTILAAVLPQNVMDAI